MKPNTEAVIDPEQSGQDSQLPAKKRASLNLLRGWRRRTSPQNEPVESSGSSVDGEKDTPPTERWSLGILNDKKTEEVPGTSMVMIHDAVF